MDQVTDLTTGSQIGLKPVNGYVNFKRNLLEATPGVEPRSTDLQAVDVDLFIL